MPLVCMQRSAHMKFQAVKLFIVLCELVQELGKRCLLHLNSFFPFSLLSALDKQNELHFVSFIPASEWLTFLYGKKKNLRTDNSWCEGHYEATETGNCFSFSFLL